MNKTALDEYNRKRDFDATSEPSGAKAKKNQKTGVQNALQFCIQKHDASRLHYNFRLKLGGQLKSWAVPKVPCLDPKIKRMAVQVEDHPIDYASFEGSIPEGHYGAGEVIVWDRGVWTAVGDAAESYAKSRLKFERQGEKLSGLWNLVRTTRQGKHQQWFLIKHQDDSAKPFTDYDIVEALPDSVLSDRTIISKKNRGRSARVVEKGQSARHHAKLGSLSNAKAGPLPDQIKPELAMLVESAPKGDWRYEIKFDGYRIMAKIEGSTVKLFTRNGDD